MSIYLKMMTIAFKLSNFISENVVYLHTTRFLGKPGHMTKIPKRGCSLGIPWRHQWRGFPKNPPTTSPETKIQRHPPKSAINAAHASRDNRSQRTGRFCNIPTMESMQFWPLVTWHRDQMCPSMTDTWLSQTGHEIVYPSVANPWSCNNIKYCNNLK